MEPGRGREQGAGPASYEDWAVALCSRFFREEHSGRRVTFFIDDDVLDELARGRNEGHGGRALCEAVRSRLQASGNLFDSMERDGFAWQRGGMQGCPPFLPLLAVAVLAASHMSRRGGIAPHNYYIRFRELLGLSGAGPPAGYGDSFPILWNWYSRWLDQVNDGRLGVSTVVEHPHYAYIGYALSQALFRESDRQRLTHFFQWIGLVPGEPVDPAELLTLFRAWVQGRAGLSPGVALMAGSDAYEEQLVQLLFDAAASWDGVLRDERGRKEARIRLTLDRFPRPVMRLAAERPVGFPAEAVFSGGGQRVELTSSVEGWYDTFPVAPSPHLLDEGLRLISDGFVLAYKPDPVVPMRQEPELGCWASVREIAPSESHWVLVKHSHRRPVVRFLERYGRPGWRLDSVPRVAPDGWVLYRDVVIDVFPADVTDHALRRLVPSVNKRPRLFGGLPSPRGQGLFLTQGEPDVWIPPELQGPTITLDGQAVEREGTDARVMLRENGLSEGVHEVRVAETRLEFRTLRTHGVVAPESTGTLAHFLDRRGDTYASASLGAQAFTTQTVANRVRVMGAAIEAATGAGPEIPRPPLVLPVGAREYALLGALPGQILCPREPERPRWIQHVGLFPSGFEVYPSFEVVWVLEHRATGWHVRPKSVLMPADSTREPREEDVGRWSQFFLDLEPQLSDEARELWASYRALAESIGDER